MNTKIETLRAIRGNDFAASLVEQFDRRGDLSPKQWEWVEKLSAPRPEPTTSAGFGRIVRLLHSAREHLQYPKITLQTERGQTVKLHVAGERSKYAGQVQVTDGGAFGNNRYFGRISEDGEYTESRDVDESVRALLVALAGDPVGVAASYGHASGNCCFCVRELTDARSLTVGYGPTCAKNYGLPWGDA